MACVIEARLRSMKTRNTAEITYAARHLIDSPENPYRQRALMRAQANRTEVDENLSAHTAECAACAAA